MSTPRGPWRWVKGAWDLRALTDADDRVILEAGSSQDMHVYDEKAGDLIASAPELLSMLRELEWTGFVGIDEGMGCPICSADRPLRLKPDNKPLPGTGEHSADCRLASLLGRFPK